MQLSKKVYDVLKFIAQIVLPAAGTLYAALAGLYNLDNPETVVGTIVAVDTFLGVLLGLSTKAYDGEFHMVIDDDGARSIGQLNLERNPEALGTQKEVRFKVSQPEDRG